MVNTLWIINYKRHWPCCLCWSSFTPILSFNTTAVSLNIQMRVSSAVVEIVSDIEPEEIYFNIWHFSRVDVARVSHQWKTHESCLEFAKKHQTLCAFCSEETKIDLFGPHCSSSDQQHPSSEAWWHQAVGQFLATGTRRLAGAESQGRKVLRYSDWKPSAELKISGLQVQPHSTMTQHRANRRVWWTEL